MDRAVSAVSQLREYSGHVDPGVVDLLRWPKLRSNGSTVLRILKQTPARSEHAKRGAAARPLAGRIQDAPSASWGMKKNSNDV